MWKAKRANGSRSTPRGLSQPRPSVSASVMSCFLFAGFLCISSHIHWQKQADKWNTLNLKQRWMSALTLKNKTPTVAPWAKGWKETSLIILSLLCVTFDFFSVLCAILRLKIKNSQAPPFCLSWSVQNKKTAWHAGVISLCLPHSCFKTNSYVKSWFWLSWAELWHKSHPFLH